MAQSEAWMVAALGMAVVFVGLLLCVGIIQLCSRLSTRVSWGEGVHGEAAPVTALPPSPAASAVAAEPVPADILAVIATAIEVERKLYVSRPDARRPAMPS